MTDAKHYINVQGHKLIKLYNDEWAFDITEGIGYKVDMQSNTVTKAFNVIIKDNGITVDKYIAVPVKVVKKAISIIESHLVEMSVTYE